MISFAFLPGFFPRVGAPLVGAAALAFAVHVTAAEPSILDDCSGAERTSSGTPRLLIDDKGLGSQSSATQTCAHGVVTVKGSLAPGRGVPAFISFALLTTPDGQPRDLSAFTGVRVRLKVLDGAISLQASSTEVTNFDYHASPLAVHGAETRELRVAFRDLKRAWSEPTPLNLKTITSINLVAFGMAKGEFAYEVDEVGFY